MEHDLYRRGSIFKEADRYFRQAMAIIEVEYGKQDLRLLPMLEGIAMLRIRQGSGLSIGERALERATRIVEGSTAADPSDLATALVRLGDMYTISSDRRASANYLQAWEMLSKDPELQPRRNQLFDHPTQLESGLPPIPTLNRMPEHAGLEDALFVEVHFSVREDGRVINVRVKDSNLPFKWRNYMKNRMDATRYRPRIVDGDAVRTEGLSHRQLFQWRRRDTTPSKPKPEDEAPEPDMSTAQAGIGSAD